MPVNKFGRSTNVDSGVVTDIHDQANATDDVDTFVAPTAARIHTIVSDNTGDTAGGAGLQTVMVYGLPTWTTAEVSELVTMDGTSGVAMTQSMVIVHRMQAVTWGASGPNIGNITATAAVDGTVTAKVLAGEGQTQMAVYGVPGGSELRLTQYYCSGIKSASAITLALKLLVNPIPHLQTTGFVTKNTLGLDSTGTSYLPHIWRPYFAVQGPAIIKIAADASAINTDVSAGFDGYFG